jgi:hypothetical protein
LGVPFPALKHPLEYFRPNLKKQGTADIFNKQIAPPKGGDTAKGPFQERLVILLSHGCELDAVQRDVDAKKTEWSRRYWLAAPVQPLHECSEKMQERTRRSQQQNKFYLPSADFLDNLEHYVDLRKITPINAPYFLEATEEKRKICSLSAEAVSALHAHLGLFFSGLVIYVQPVPCPVCNTQIDPKSFVTRSPDEEEPD